MWLSLFLVVCGLVFLVKSADALVTGSSSIAKRLGVRQIVIGLTVVAFGTSVPELVVNLMAALQGNASIAIGNVIGSNISNLLLILGVTSVMTPLVMTRGTVWKEIPLMFLGAVLLWLMASDALFTGNPSILDRIDGIVFLSFFIIFLYYTFGMGKVEGESEAVEKLPMSRSLAFILLGLVGLFIGGKMTVDGAVGIAQAFGVSDALIALTVIAFGTSLPELVTSVTAALKGQTGIAVGNAIGSSIFNVFWVLGLSAVVLPLPFSTDASIDALVFVGASLLVFIGLFLGKRNILHRWEGATFLCAYVAYIGYVVWRG